MPTPQPKEVKRRISVHKLRAVAQWSKHPIGTQGVAHPEGSKQFFDAIAKHRYEVYAPWLKSTFGFEQYKGKRVLEIGTGTGTDHVELAKAGAILSGVDITPKSIALTKKNLVVNGYSSELRLGDAERLPFADDSFDAVFSIGVLHHTPNIQQAVNEIHRVLRPGGKASIAVYHKNSLFYWLGIIILNRILRGKFLTRTLEEQLSEVEFGGAESRPLVRVLTRKEMRELFGNFRHVHMFTRHGGVTPGTRLSKVLNIGPIKKIFDFLSRRFGWYLIVEAVK